MKVESHLLNSITPFCFILFIIFLSIKVYIVLTITIGRVSHYVPFPNIQAYGFDRVIQDSGEKLHYGHVSNMPLWTLKFLGFG